jgi:hypothetical protein
MRRTLMLVAVVLLIVFSFRDPYTFRWGGGDFVVPAPWWQTVLGLLDLVLLTALSVAIWRSPSIAWALLLSETCFTLALSVGYLLRDGLMRFSTGFSGLSYLFFFLAGLLIRALLIWTLQRRRFVGDPTPELRH